MSAFKIPSPLVSHQWLLENLNQPDLIVLDVSVPKPGMKAPEPFIPYEGVKDALYFDLNGKFSNKESSLPHMMCSEAQFQEEARKLGIHKNSIIVVYDIWGIFSSARVWWMFKTMGHQQVAVLDGGIMEWKKAGHPMNILEVASKEQGDFVAKFNPNYFINAIQVKGALDKEEVTLLDARSEDRFYGKTPEPREGLRGGHMPNAKNIPYVSLQNGHFMKPIDEIQQIFESKAA